MLYIHTQKHTLTPTHYYTYYCIRVLYTVDEMATTENNNVKHSNWLRWSQAPNGCKIGPFNDASYSEDGSYTRLIHALILEQDACLNNNVCQWQMRRLVFSLAAWMPYYIHRDTNTQRTETDVQKVRWNGDRKEIKGRLKPTRPMSDSSRKESDDDGYTKATSNMQHCIRHTRGKVDTNAGIEELGDFYSIIYGK